MTDSIIVLKGETEEVRELRKAIIKEFPGLSHLIFDDYRKNKHVPDLQDGYLLFNALFEVALHGPTVTALRNSFLRR